MARYLHFFFHCFNILYRTNSSMNIDSLLDCCYFKTTNFVFLNTDVGFYYLLVFTPFIYSLIKIRLPKSIKRLKRGTNVAKQTSFNAMCRTVTSSYIYRKYTWCSFFDKFLRRSSVFVNENTVLCRL